jgi:hypothetical protein
MAHSISTPTGLRPDMFSLKNVLNGSREKRAAEDKRPMAITKALPVFYHQWRKQTTWAFCLTSVTLRFTVSA